jgi:hypothetical protein
LIEQIVSSSRIPSGKRRRELLRELRSHVEDFVLNARSAGHAEAEIEKQVVARFGDPHLIGQNFAWVYRRERAALHFFVFGLCTLAVATLIAAGVLAMQAGLWAGLGVPVLRTLGSRHTLIEAADILATVAAYVGIISLERLFGRRGTWKAVALLALCFAVLFVAFAAAGIRAPFLVLGFANAFFLRTVQMLLKGRLAQFAAVVPAFGLFGVVLLWVRSPGLPYSVIATSASWLLMGIGYQVMTGLAARFDRGLFNRLQQL